MSRSIHLKALRRDVALPLPTLNSGTQGSSVGSAKSGTRLLEHSARLPATLQAAATLALIEERPYEEIAEALGTSTSAVKSRIFRAVRILRRKLERLGIKP
jgi:DNA-directed RNA polymerase specialized sigma24 family protein